jgi:hypothetical protein
MSPSKAPFAGAVEVEPISFVTRVGSSAADLLRLSQVGPTIPTAENPIGNALEKTQQTSRLTVEEALACVWQCRAVKERSACVLQP